MNATEAIQLLTGDAARWQEPLVEAMARFDISTDDRCAMFLAQCAHESQGFARLVENLNYSAEGLARTWPSRFRMEDDPTHEDDRRRVAEQFAHDPVRIAEAVYGGRLGNRVEGLGDGWRYRGRGLVMTTGASNYRAAGDAIGLNLFREPALLEQPAAAAASAGYYWRSRGCNQLADIGDFREITRRISGATLGMDDRLAWLDKARDALAA